MSSGPWTWYAWRCRRQHRHPLPATDEALRHLLARVARRRGRWIVIEGPDGRFGQAVAARRGQVCVELSDGTGWVVWAMRPVRDNTTRGGELVRLRGVRGAAPVWTRRWATWRPGEAAALIAAHLHGLPLPTGVATRRVWSPS